MESNYIEECRIAYFNEVFSKDKTSKELMEYFHSYTGPIYNDQINHLLAEINQREVSGGNGSWSRSDLIEPDFSLTERSCRAIGKGSEDIYLQPVHDIEWSASILPASTNEHRSIILPMPLSQRLAWAERPSFEMHALAADSIFISPNGFCALRSAKNAYWPLAASRKFSGKIASGMSGTIDGPAVLVQDRYDGGNFAHFLFDWVVRIVAFAQKVPNAREYKFLMGGKSSDFHLEIISCLCDWLGLSLSNFYWPAQSQTVTLAGGVVIFSDTMLIPAHPAQMQHPFAAGVIDELSQRLKINASSIGRVYVSRSDAALRKLVNEKELIKSLESHGYRSLRLSDFGMREQFSLLAGARSVVAPHGMGLTHLALRSGKLDLLELFHPGIGSDAYAFLASAKKFAYAPLLGHAIDDDKGSYEIDVAAVAAHVVNMS